MWCNNWTCGFGDCFILLFKSRSSTLIPARHMSFSFKLRITKDLELTSDVATSLGTVRSHPINTLRIPQMGRGPCRRPQHVQPSCRWSSRVMDWRGYDFGRKPMMSTLPTAGTPSIDSFDTVSAGQTLALMKGSTASTRPPTPTPSGRTWRFLGGMRKGDGTGGHIGTFNKMEFSVPQLH